MTTTIELDRQTAEALTAQAQAMGLSLETYLRRLSQVAVFSPSNGTVSLDDFDRYLDELAADLPRLAPLPADFSRADIYRNHD